MYTVWLLCDCIRAEYIRIADTLIHWYIDLNQLADALIHLIHIAAQINWQEDRHISDNAVVKAFDGIAGYKRAARELQHDFYWCEILYRIQTTIREKPKSQHNLEVWIYSIEVESFISDWSHMISISFLFGLQWIRSRLVIYSGDLGLRT